MVLEDAGSAVMRAVAGFSAAASPAATAGRMESMSSGCRFGVGGWGGPPVTWRPGGPIWLAAVGEGGAGLRSSPSGFGWAGVLQCVRLCGLASAGGNSSRGLHSGAGRGGPGFSWVCAGGVCGPLGGWACRGAWGSPWWLCAGCWMWGVVRSVRRVGPWRGCAVVCAVGGGPCRGARGCAQWWACVGRRVGSGGGGAWAGVARGLCLVSVYVSACSGALVWSVVGRAAWRRSLLSSAAAARISRTSMRIWCTFWSVVGGGYASSGLSPRILWMAWYPQVRQCCGLAGGVLPRVSACPNLCVGGEDGPHPGTVPVDSRQRCIHLARQRMTSPRW